MAKKKEGPLQLDITTEEDWQDLLKRDGLWLVDVYRDWSGPCLCIQSMIKKIKTDIEDEILQFAMAPADKIEQLAPFRETCEPQWLFVAAGQFVAFIKGTNVVALMDMIKSEVAHERAVLNGKATRRLVKNVKSWTKTPKSLLDVEREQVQEKKAFETSLHKIRDIAKMKLIAKELLGRSFTIAIIKPDAVQSGKTHAIMNELNESGFRILHQQERILTDEDVGEIYRLEKAYNYAVYGLARLMTHGPSLILIVVSTTAGEDVVEKFRLMLGPPNTTVARRNHPKCLRARYGTEGFNNGLHASQNQAAVQRELNLFFPVVAEELADGPLLLQKPLTDFVEYALVVIRPHTLQNFNKEFILGAFERANLQLIAEKSVEFTQQTLKELYHHLPPAKMSDCLMSGASYVVVVEANNLYAGRLFDIFGPDSVVEARRKYVNSLRAIYSKDDRLPSAFHVSESQDAAVGEVAIFFPRLAVELQQIRNIQQKMSKVDIQRATSKLTHLQQIIVVVTPKTLQMHKVDDILNTFRDARFNIYAQKYVTVNVEQATELLKPFNDLYAYQRMVKDLVNEPSLVLCILCEQAINKLKIFLGPWDPMKAKIHAPNSLRAVFETNEISPFFMSERPESLSNDVKMFFPEIFLNTSRLAIMAFPQHCVILISPYIVKKFNTDYVYQMFEEDEIPIVLDKFMSFTPKLINEIYFSNRNAIIWNRTVKVLTEGEVLILAIYTTDAVRLANDGIRHGRLATLCINNKDAVHVRASLDVSEARKEMQLFFPRETIITIIKPYAFSKHKEKILQMIANVGLLIVGQSVERLTQQQAMLFYAHAAKTAYFQQLVDNLAKGKVLVLALNGYSARIAWKKLAGPKDPKQAVTNAPKSIRALYGKSIIENAVDECHDPNILDKIFSQMGRRPPSLSVEAIGNAISIAT